MLTALLILWASQAIPTDASSAAAEPPTAVTAPSPKLPRKLAKIYATGDGQTRDTAFKVSSVDEEYALLRALGLHFKSQSLVNEQGKHYDRMSVENVRTKETYDVWFDINSFFLSF